VACPMSEDSTSGRGANLSIPSSAV
jgi:hypothetical protein